MNSSSDKRKNANQVAQFAPLCSRVVVVVLYCTTSMLILASLPCGASIKSWPQSGTSAHVGTNASSLIEWDDEDLNGNELMARSNLFESSMLTPARPAAVFANNRATRRAGASVGTASARRKGSGRLVFHGRVSAAGELRQLSNGLEAHIDTHQPVAISRRSFGNMLGAATGPIGGDEVEEPSAPYARLSADSPASTTPRTIAAAAEPLRSARKQRTSTPAFSEASANWRPIIASDGSSTMKPSFNQRTSDSYETLHKLSRAHDEQIVAPHKSRRHTHKQSIEVAAIISSEAASSRWKPIMTNHIDGAPEKGDDLALSHAWLKRRSEKLLASSTATATKSPVSNIVYGLPSSERKPQTTQPALVRSSIEDPFDDDGIIVTKRQLPTHKANAEWSLEPIQPDNGSSKKQAAVQIANGESRWMPMSSDALRNRHAESNSSPANATAVLQVNATVANNNTTEQRSASDLNYIYSSQPAAVAFSNAVSAGYYPQQNYQQQQQQQVQPQPQPQPQPQLPPNELPIIDTTSGQMPEMIADRTPETQQQQTIVQTTSDYSAPQSTASFQPLQVQQQAQPQRQPYVVQQPQQQSYGNYGGEVQPVSNYYTSGRQEMRYAPTAVQAQQQQPQVMRQEHHYHYYNQRDTSSADVTRSAASASTTTPAPSQVIRELQPVFISQPAAMITAQQQQPAVPAPPPQIIREIIREVPAAPTRTVLIPPPPPPIPLPVRAAEFGEQVSFVADAGPPQFASQPARQLIRQISNNLPLVSVRMPATVRLPIPTVQLPGAGAAVRATAQTGGVTRHSGSFIIPPVPKKTTTYLTETQAVPSHTTIMHTTQFTPATRTTVYTTDHQTPAQTVALQAAPAYRAR